MLPTSFAKPLDYVFGVVASPYSAGSTSLTVEDPTPFASASPANWLRLTCIRGSDKARVHLKVTGVTGNNLAIAGTLDGYAAISLDAKDAIYVSVNKGTIGDIQTAINTLEVTGGPPGPQGSQGATGGIGAQGSAGEAGPQGGVGPQGSAGVAGSQGSQGANGFGAVGSPVVSSTPGGVLFVDAGGNLAQDAALKFNASGKCLLVRKDYNSSSINDYNPQTVFLMVGNPTSDSSSYAVQHRILYKNGYPGDPNPPDSCAIDFTTGAHGGQLILWSGGDGNGGPMKKAFALDYNGDANFYYGINFLSDKTIIIGQNNNTYNAKLQITPNLALTEGLSLNGRGGYGDNILPLTVRGIDANSTLTGGIDNSGHWFMGPGQSLASMVSIQPIANSLKGLVVRGASGQSANLQEWQDSSGTTLVSVDPAGALKGPSNLLTVNSQLLIAPVANGVAPAVYFFDQYAGIRRPSGGGFEFFAYGNPNAMVLTEVGGGVGMGVDGATVTNLNAKLIVCSNYYNQKGIIVRSGPNSTNENLQEWQNSSGTALAKIDPNGVATVAGLQLSSGTVSPAYLGTGTPSAGKYLDGSGAWTTLPSSGGSGSGTSVGSPVSGGIANSVLYTDASGNVGNDAAFEYLPSLKGIMLKGAGVSFQNKYNNVTLGNSSQRISYRFGYDTYTYTNDIAPEVAAIELLTSNTRGELGFFVGGNVNGDSALKEAIHIYDTGNVEVKYGLSYIGSQPFVLATTTNYTPSAKLVVSPWNTALVGMNLQTNDFYSECRPLIITTNNSSTVWGGIDNKHRWYMGLPDALNSMLSVQTNTNNEPAIIVRTKDGQTANLQEWQNSSGTVLTAIKPDGSFTYLSASKGYTHCEHFGLGATSAGGSDNTAIGYGTQGSTANWQTENTVIGSGSYSQHNGNVIIGVNSKGLYGGNVVIGNGLTASSFYSVLIGSVLSSNNASVGAIGYSCSSTYVGSLAIGWGVDTKAAGEFVFGARNDANINPSIRLSGSTAQYSGCDTALIASSVVDNSYPTAHTEQYYNPRTRVAISAYDEGGAKEGIRVEASGTEAKIGFYGKTAIAKQPTPTTLAEAIAVLQNLGLCQ